MQENTGFVCLSLQGIVGIPYDVGHLLLVVQVRRFSHASHSLGVSLFGDMHHVFDNNVRVLPRVGNCCAEIAPVIQDILAENICC